MMECRMCGNQKIFNKNGLCTKCGFNIHNDEFELIVVSVSELPREVRNKLTNKYETKVIKKSN